MIKKKFLAPAFLLGLSFQAQGKSTHEINTCSKLAAQSLSMRVYGSEDQSDTFCWFGKGSLYSEGAVIGTKALDIALAGKTSLAQAAFENPTKYRPRPGHPAQNYCSQLQGEVWKYEVRFAQEPTTETGMCVFSDGSMVNQWALFRLDSKVKQIFAKLALKN